MDDVIGKLTAAQALEVLRRLSRKDDAIRAAVVAEATRLLSEVGLDETAEDVYSTLESIDVEGLWSRSGKSRYGYTSPDEAAVWMVEEELEPFAEQAAQYHDLGMFEEEATHAKGVILGLYRFETECHSEFRQWAEDIPLECAGHVLDQWRARNQVPALAEAMADFLRQRCPKWCRIWDES